MGVETTWRQRNLWSFRETQGKTARCQHHQGIEGNLLWKDVNSWYHGCFKVESSGSATYTSPTTCIWNVLENIESWDLIATMSASDRGLYRYPPMKIKAKRVSLVSWVWKYSQNGKIWYPSLSGGKHASSPFVPKLQGESLYPNIGCWKQWKEHGDHWLADFLGINQCKMHVNFQRFPLIIYNRTCFGLEKIYRNIMIPAKT